MKGSLTTWNERMPLPINRFSTELEHLMEQFFGMRENGWHGFKEFLPNTNVAETDEGYEVSLDLPGVDPDEVKVELENGSLRVSGERSEEKEEKGKTFHRVERTTGEFRRVVPLPGPVRRRGSTGRVQGRRADREAPQERKGTAQADQSFRLTSARQASHAGGRAHISPCRFCRPRIALQ